jgi:hypothetical protein
MILNNDGRTEIRQRLFAVIGLFLASMFVVAVKA